MSYPDETWVKSDPDFWKPAPKMAAAKPAAKEKANSKPAC
jgi:hypothetical protein